MFFDIIGWVGTILVLIAYLLLSTNKINNGKLYQTLNLFASLFMAIGLLLKNAWFSFALQIIWAIIAIISLINICTKSKNSEK